MFDYIHVPSRVLIPAAPNIVVKVTAVNSSRKFSCPLIYAYVGSFVSWSSISGCSAVTAGGDDTIRC